MAIQRNVGDHLAMVMNTYSSRCRSGEMVRRANAQPGRYFFFPGGLCGAAFAAAVTK